MEWVAWIVACVLVGLAVVGVMMNTPPDESPPRWETKCISYQTDIMPMMLDGKNITLMPVNRCVEYGPACVAGADYEGEVKCD